MKIIVFGLGNFGMSLSLSLTETGNEVIGIDKNMEKVQSDTFVIQIGILIYVENDSTCDKLKNHSLF